MTARPPAFAAAFQPASPVTDEHFSRFHRFLPPIEDESPSAYATRLERAGLALAFSAEQMRDVPLFKETMAAARLAGLPIAVVTAPVPDPAGDRAAERAAKSPEQWLSEARRSTK
jgi:hypothetical protein